MTRAQRLNESKPKELIVKNARKSTWNTKAYLERAWAEIETTLSTTFSEAGDIRSKEKAQHNVELICRSRGASTLFAKLSTQSRKHIRSEAQIVLKAAEGASDGVAVLRIVLDAWKRWKHCYDTLRAIFAFLDRTYLLHAEDKDELHKFFPRLFREAIFSDSSLEKRVVQGTCDLVSAARSEQPYDFDLLKRAVDMFYRLEVYNSLFEPAVMELSRTYFVDWSNRMIVEKSVPDYVDASNAAIASEKNRCVELGLNEVTRKALFEILQTTLIDEKETDLTGYEGLAPLLKDNAVTRIRALHKLLARRNLSKNLQPAFGKWIGEAGTDIVFSQDEDTMIVRLLTLKAQIDRIAQEAFENEDGFSYTMQKNFENFMNKTKKGEATWGTDNTKVGEMIAKHIDQLLRGDANAIKAMNDQNRSQKPASHEQAGDEEEYADEDEETDINAHLDRVLELFRFVQGKAVFEAFYKKALARRLLMGKSTSAAAESKVLTRLREECGSAFTHNLETMFKDMDLAREDMQAYKQLRESRTGRGKDKGLDFSVNVLNSSAWPTYPNVKAVIPAGVQEAAKDFESYYSNKHTGRKLEWHHELAHCQVRASFPNGAKELVVSSFQALVLLLFNKMQLGEHISYSTILNETGLPAVEVKRTLQSLACAKLRPLRKHPKGKDINDDDTFTINESFVHPKYRVKINQIQLKETKEENKETHIRVAQDRAFECQAAIVRILKSKKTISHQQLVSELIKATISRGVLAMADIKKNIDRLIEKDYMERADGNMYTYLA
ncbi:Cullin-domain-containing protein [Piedraia hortae CBS 480.64]|uniref:Cullin-domain-containing protein n=1 Tax=Piedraia hortae CBS 480.64 TaxID=1314780 RepID=A0A6A7C9A0_9PEZI|nr:Cullin-domain-containing protein [Piedraia hortae CBS 480.64]